MVYFGIENNIIPEIGKYYAFKYRSQEPNAKETYLHIGECILTENGYKWAMKDLNTGKIYFPYCSDVFDLSKPMMSADWERTNKNFD